MKEETADREAHRKEMVALMTKRMHRKGAQPALRAAPIQHAPVQQPAGDVRIEASDANEGRFDTATAADRNRVPEHVGVNKVPVEIHGETKDIDINSCADLHAFYEAVKDKFGPQIKAEVGMAPLFCPEMSPAYMEADFCCLPVFAGVAAGLQCFGANQSFPQDNFEQDDAMAPLFADSREDLCSAELMVGHFVEVFLRYHRPCRESRHSILITAQLTVL